MEVMSVKNECVCVCIGFRSAPYDSSWEKQLPGTRSCHGDGRGARGQVKTPGARLGTGTVTSTHSP